jgi:hypothetical protein
MTTLQRRAQTNFTAGSETRRVTGFRAPQQDHAPVKINTDPEKPPVGTAREVLGWVGVSASRAQRAIEVEEHTADPRKVLIANLRKIAFPKASKHPKPTEVQVHDAPLQPVPAPAPRPEDITLSLPQPPPPAPVQTQTPPPPPPSPFDAPTQ